MATLNARIARLELDAATALGPDRSGRAGRATSGR